MSMESGHTTPHVSFRERGAPGAYVIDASSIFLSTNLFEIVRR